MEKIKAWFKNLKMPEWKIPGKKYHFAIGMGIVLLLAIISYIAGK